MKTDISKLPSGELKHYLNVLLQMGRVQLDSDWNEQSELWLRLLQRHAADAVRSGSPNHGFRVDDRILLDAMDSRAGWVAEKAGAADPDPRLFVDYFDHRTGDGSLTVEGAIALMRRLPRPLDLRGLAEVVIAAKGLFNAANCVVTLGRQGTRVNLTTTEDAQPLAGWRIFRATGVPGGFDLGSVDEYGLTNFDKTRRYQFDFVKIDRPIRLVMAPTWTPHGFSATPLAVNDVPRLAVNDDQRRYMSPVLEVTKAGSVTDTFPVLRDLRHVRKLILSARSGTANAGIAVKLVDAANNQATIIAPATLATANAWQEWIVTLPAAGIDPSQVKAIRWESLTADQYLLSPVLLEMDLEGNLVIMGGDGTAEGAGRFYGDGLAAVKESHETYFSQRDLPEADPAPLAPPAEGTARVDLACLDLWERPVTYIEDPEIREIALEGPDTCTRIQLVAQVRIVKGGEVAIGTTPTPPLAAFAALPSCGKGTLTTKDNPAAVLDPCADPCEPEVVGTFVGEENRLFRVEIHGAGGVGPAGAGTTATFKWSRENGAAAAALTEDAAAAGFSATVEQPELFREGDLIEIADDLEDLITGPYTDRSQTRGDLRRITSIKPQDRLISWEDATAADPAMHAPLTRTYRVAYHARVRRWDGLLPATPGDIVLADGVVIELGGGQMLPGDFWVFTTRVADRSVERLIEAPPRGICHRYYKLATISRQTQGGVETVVIDDCRPDFTPLTALRATDVAFDPGCCTDVDDPEWAKVGTVQEAIDAICRMDLNADLKTHNKYLHGYGVVCGLRVGCDSLNRGRVVIGAGYALDCEGNQILVRSPLPFNVVPAAKTKQLLDNNSLQDPAVGSGEVCLTIARGATQDAVFDVEPKGTQSFWDGVLEGTLLKDFYEDCIQSLLDFFKQRFLPIPDTAIPVSDKNKRVITALNLFFGLINSASGQYVFLSRAEHDLMLAFYTELRNLLQSHTFCGMFDNARPFPVYPYLPPPAGTDTANQTAFGHFLTFHKRLRVRPPGDFAYTCGSGDAIQVFRLSTRELVQRLTFPGGAEVQDVAFSADGSELYAVAIVNGADSVFVTATIAPDGTHTWGAPTIVCDKLFVTLATHALHPNRLFALCRGEGMYKLDPAAIDVTTAAKVTFNATGILRVSADGEWAFAGERVAPGSLAEFDRIRRMKLTAPPAADVLYVVTGPDEQNDVALFGTLVYVTGNPAPKTLHVFPLAGGAALHTVALGVNTLTRLALLPGRSELLVAMADPCKVLRVNLAPSPPAVVPNHRIPAQGFPVDIAVAPGQNEIYVLNGASCTLTVVDAAFVIDTPPLFTNEPPVTLSAYRQDVIGAFSDLFKGLAQYLKDCFCEHFLVECPECDETARVYLGCVDIRNGKVYNICNFDKRHYVKTFRTWSYWLSTVPVLPLVKRLFAQFCCLVLP